jgi:hypothetical protein
MFLCLIFTYRRLLWFCVVCVCTLPAYTDPIVELVPQSDGSPANKSIGDVNGGISRAGALNTSSVLSSRAVGNDAAVSHASSSRPSSTSEGTASSAIASSGAQSYGKGVDMDDADLIDLLRRPPKSTMILRTKGSFQEFFRGISSTRMHALLTKAYADLGDEDERQQKVNKRMSLLTEVFS